MNQSNHTSNTPCLFCRSAEKRYLYSVHDFLYNRRDRIFDLYECSSCGIISYLPELTAEQLAGYYPPDYAAKTFSSSRWGAPAMYKVYKAWSLGRQVGKALSGLNILDVGCSRGDLLMSFRKKGARVSGIETNPDDVKALGEKGITVYKSVTEILEKTNARFDAIFMSHVIEHFANPAEELGLLFTALKPGGRIIVVTPNAHSLGRRIFKRFWFAHHIPQHIFVFNKKNLGDTLARIGFSVVSMTDVVAPNILQESMRNLFRSRQNAFARKWISPIFSLQNVLFLMIFYIPAVIGTLLGISDIIMAVADKPVSGQSRK
jgi:2-polyprenyl-3-methyl-5-hydroxy-6-metoxy-1,4-benzoquinol methylase